MRILHYNYFRILALLLGIAINNNTARAQNPSWPPKMRAFPVFSFTAEGQYKTTILDRDAIKFNGSIRSPTELSQDYDMRYNGIQFFTKGSGSSFAPRMNPNTWVVQSRQIFMEGGIDTRNNITLKNDFNYFPSNSIAGVEYNSLYVPRLGAVTFSYSFNSQNFIYIFGGRNNQQYFNDLYSANVSANALFNWELRYSEIDTKRPTKRAFAGTWLDETKGSAFIFGGASDRGKIFIIQYHSY